MDALLNSFPARNLGYKSNDRAVARHILLHHRVFVSELPYSLIQQKPLILSGFIIALISLVIPAVEEVVLVYLKHSKRCAIFAVCAHITLTDELTC